MCFFYFWKKKKPLHEQDYFDINKCNIVEECAICLEPLNSDICIKTKKCDHLFHHKCYVEYINSRIKNNKQIMCPYCSTVQ